MNKYTFQLFEVIDENTHKYATTTVRSEIFNNDRIESRTKHYSEQNIWIKNIDTNQEEQLNLPTGYNMPVRAGHKILCAYNNKQFIQINNITTGATLNFIQHKEPSFIRSAFQVAFVFIPMIQVILGIIFTIESLLLMKESYVKYSQLIKTQIKIAILTTILCLAFFEKRYLSDETIWFIYFLINTLIAYQVVKMEFIYKKIYLLELEDLKKQSNQYLENLTIESVQNSVSPKLVKH